MRKVLFATLLLSAAMPAHADDGAKVKALVDEY